MYEHLEFDKPAPERYLEMLLCDRFGWTLDELDNADPDRIEEFLVMWSVETEHDKGKQK